MTDKNLEKSLLIVAYKIEKGKGSEDGSGYQALTRLIEAPYKITLISRVNNIELLQDDELFNNVELVGIDVPKWLAFYKKGNRGIIPYYYLWQIFVGRKVKALKKVHCYDIIHQFNFHTDWAPHFLNNKGGLLIWGPLMHHEVVPLSSLRFKKFSTSLFEIIKQAGKLFFWTIDPFLKRAISATDVVLYANHNLAPPFEKAQEKIHYLQMPGANAVFATEPLITHEFIVLAVGRFVPLKGFDLGLEAYANSCTNPAFRKGSSLLFIGSGTLKNHLIKRAAELRIEEKLVIVEWVAHEELLSYYRKASVFLYPSYESQGLVVSEAMASGTPVITIDGTGPAFLAADHITQC